MQPSKRYLFVEWRHWESTIVLGVLAGPKFKREILLTCAVQELTSSEVSKWLGHPKMDEVLLFFHAMWGQQANFQRKNLRSFEKILGHQPANGIQTVISFIWYAGGVSYSINWQRALKKGEPLGRLIEWICAHYSNSVNVFCHSMGNRFFEGALRTVTEHAGIELQGTTLLRKAILFSPDLDAEINDPEFLRLCRSSEEVVVFMHRRDRHRMLSAWSLGRNRLGRSGPQHNMATFPALPNLKVIDMTDYVQGIHNHTHLDKEWVQQRIREVLKA